MEKKTLIELKALAFDCIANKELWERRLLEINQKIHDFKEESKEVVLPENKEDETKKE